MDQHARRAAHTLAFFVWGLAALNLWSALFAHAKGRIQLLREYLPLEVLHGSRLLTVVAAFLLVFLAYGLWRHKRRAWQAAAVTIGASAALHLLKGLDWEEALVSLGVLTGLIALRRRFRAQSDPPSLRRGLVVAAMAVLFACAYGTVGFYFLDREFHARFTAVVSLEYALRLMFTFGGAPLPHTRHAEWFLASLYVVGALTLAYSATAALRPVVYRSVDWEQDLRRAQELAVSYGRSSLARLTLLPDKLFFFPPGLEAYCAYRLVGNVAVVLGDVIGADAEIAAAIGAFHEQCEEMDWTPCYYQVVPDYLDLYRAQGYDALKIGEEAVIELGSFDLKGGAWKDVRNTINKLRSAGVESHFHTSPIDDSLLQSVKEVSDEWLRLMHGGEKRFSLGWFDSDYLRQCDIQVVVSSSGRIEAFANYFSQYQTPIMSPDMMRRRAEAVTGVMDFLFVSAALHYKEKGLAGLNLGLAPLSGVGVAEDARLAERMVRLMYERLNRFYSFKGLRAFKAKFHPRWEPRYLIYASKASLPKAALAVVRANNPWLLSRL